MNNQSRNEEQTNGAMQISKSNTTNEMHFVDFK